MRTFINFWALNKGLNIPTASIRLRLWIPIYNKSLDFLISMSELTIKQISLAYLECLVIIVWTFVFFRLFLILKSLKVIFYLKTWCVNFFAMDEVVFFINNNQMILSLKVVIVFVYFRLFIFILVTLAILLFVIQC